MNDHNETWDDVIEQVEKETFVGRAHELARFREEIAKAKPGKLIFYISGQGGVGKTKLLERFQEIAREQQFLVVESDDLQKDIPTILGHFARQLTQAGQKMEPFAERYALYRQLRQEIESDVEAPQGLAGALARTSLQLVWGLLDELPMARQVTKLAPDAMREGTATQASEWANYLSRKLKNKDDVALMRDPVAELSPLFFQALNKLAQKHKLLLCFDNYEYSRSYLDDWLTRLRDHRPSPNIRLALAGRDLPGPKWDGLKSVLSHIPLEVFTPEEAEAFLDLRGIENPQRRQEILQFSDRLPVLMDWLAVPSGDGTDPHMPTNDIVERFLRWERDPALRQTMLNLAVPYTFNQDLVALLLEKESPADVEAEFTWLCHLPSTRQRENGWQYHDVVRRRLLYYLRQKSPRTYAGLHSRLAAHYQMERERLGLTPEKQWVNARWQAYTVEYLYHHLVAAPDTHWLEVLNLFTLALRHQRSLAQRVMERLALPASCDELSLGQQQMVDLCHRHLDAIQADDLSGGAEMFARLCQETGLSDQARAIAFAYRGEAHRLLQTHAAALADFDRAIALDEKDDWAIALRGETYRLMGNHAAALADFDRAIALDEKDDWAIAHRGETYRQMGEYAAALADFDRAIALDEKYAVAIALRGDTYGQMGEYAAALADFDRAIALDEKYAFAIASRGVTYRLMGEYAAALADSDRAIALGEKYAFAIANRGETYRLMGEYAAALADFDRAIELDEKYAFAIASRGVTYRLMGEYAAALADFDRAIALDEKDAWAIAGRGVTYRLMGEYAAALADFDRAIALDEKDAWAIAGRGVTYRQMGEYAAALADFDRAIALNEKDAWAIASRGQTYQAMGEYATALADFDRAIELDESDWYCYQRHLIYQAQLQQGPAARDIERAIALAEQDYEKNQEDWQNTFNLALYHLAAGQAAAAERLYREGASAPAFIVREAVQDLEDLLAVLPGHEQAAAMRRYLAQALEERERGQEGAA